MSGEAKPTGFLAKYGQRLIDNGFEIIPIKRGSKAPPMKDWQRVRATRQILRQWIDGPYAKSGVGILTRLTPLVDIDVLDQGVADALTDYIIEQYGAAPIRYGMAPKRGLLFRAGKSFPKVNSEVWEDEWADATATYSQHGKPVGHLRKVEILGAGQQFVAYARHPDTGQPYTWVDGRGPATVKAADLPLLTEEAAHDIAEQFSRLAKEAGWSIHKESRALSRPAGALTGGVIDHDDVFAADAAPIDLSEDELHAKLLLVPGAEDYDTWLQIGMALFHQFGGEDRGLELWHEWSSTAGNYDADALDDKWQTFDITEKGRAPVTARLILKLAAAEQEKISTETFADITLELRSAIDLKQLMTVCEKIKHIEFDTLHRAQLVSTVQKRFKEIAGSTLTISTARDMVRFENPKPKDLPRWLEGWVYIAHRNAFYSIDLRIEMGVEPFNNVHNRFMLTKRDVLEGKSIPEVSASTFALNNKQIETVQLSMYMPGEDALFWYNGVKCVNTYSERNIPSVPEKLTRQEREAIERVKAHLDILFPSEDRFTFLAALAWLVQNPGRRLNWAILLQGTEGDGKTFFAGLLGAVLGPDNVRNMAAQSLEEKFTGWAEGSQVVFFEEIKLHGHNRYDVLNRVKPLITNQVVAVRRMQTDVYNAPNTVTYILTTNYRDALPLNEDDSRYFILFSRFQTKAALAEFKAEHPGYFTDLYATLDYAGALRRWLLEYEVPSTFDSYDRAPDSKARAEMVAYNATEEEDALSEILAEAQHHDITSVLLDSTSLAEAMGEKGVDVPYGKAMNALLLKHGFTQLGKKVWVSEEKGARRLWSRTPLRWESPKGLRTADIRRYLDNDL